MLDSHCQLSLAELNLMNQWSDSVRGCMPELGSHILPPQQCQMTHEQSLMLLATLRHRHKSPKKSILCLSGWMEDSSKNLEEVWQLLCIVRDWDELWFKASAGELARSTLTHLNCLSQKLGLKSPLLGSPWRST